ncbi:MAG: hypothetical protein UH654_07925 [Lachnospiraceae bacterium]|nr:hypothetical protein [Lachnospiraceae bacterium]MEE0959941.1 hypothetical protein [Lachnospiraceae bacterium]
MEQNVKIPDGFNMYYMSDYAYIANIRDAEIITGNRKDDILERYQEFVNMRDEHPDYYCELACGPL